MDQKDAEPETTTSSDGNGAEQQPKRTPRDTTNLVAVIFLGLAILGVIGTVAAINIYGNTVPDALIAIGAAAVGGLAGLLSFHK